MSIPDTSPVSAAQLESWRGYIGRRKIEHEVLDAAVLQRFAMATGAAPDVERRQPPMAHWAYFLEAAPSESLGEDGHPLRGEFLPPVHLPRRMFASAAIRFERPLELGREAACTTTITDVKHKSGQSGELVFVELERRLEQSQATRVIEKRTLVYRAAGAKVPPVVPGACDTPGESVWRPGSVDLFRFSAVTFNAHRIHYDALYARGVEGYPDLVVHGPFTATKLLSFALESGGRAVRSFEFRVIAPLFVAQNVTFARGPGPGSFVALRCDGSTAVAATAEYLS